MAVREDEGEELVLGFLADATGDYVSGEVVSDKLGLSPAAVYRHVNALRAQGYRIDALPARGYRLVEVPDRVTPLEIRPLLATHDLGQVLHCCEVIGSTNDRAMELAEEGAAHGETVIAESQTSGRGRRGRGWISPPGKNLILSIVLRPDLPAARAPELTLVSAVALCQVLRNAGAGAGIKWPNDLVVNDRKLAGILAETAADRDRLRWAVLGMGVNLNASPEDFPEELRDRTTSLCMERGEPTPRAAFAAALLNELEAWLDRHSAEGFEPVRKAWRDWSVTLGRKVRVETGGEPICGTAEDIDETGALLVRSGGERIRVVAGDVVHLETR